LTWRYESCCRSSDVIAKAGAAQMMPATIAAAAPPATCFATADGCAACVLATELVPGWSAEAPPTRARHSVTFIVDV